MRHDSGNSSAKAARGAGLRAAAALAVVLAAFAAPLGGCSYFNSEPTLAFEDEPVGKLYNEALNELGDRNYKEAAKKFQEVERQHPYSPWARKAIVMSAFAQYETGNYEESIADAQRYLTLYPGSEDAPYAQYLIAQSYYDQIPDITRDQQQTQKALEALREVARRYPDTDYARSARQKVHEAYDQLAGKEMEVGRYYLRHKNYVSAINRFKAVVSDYQVSSQVEEALMRLTEAYMALGITSEAQTATAILGHNYPSSPWYKDAYSLLQSGGLEPREDKGSWLSRVWQVASGA